MITEKDGVEHNVPWLNSVLDVSFVNLLDKTVLGYGKKKSPKFERVLINSLSDLKKSRSADETKGILKSLADYIDSIAKVLFHVEHKKLYNNKFDNLTINDYCKLLKKNRGLELPYERLYNIKIGNYRSLDSYKELPFNEFVEENYEVLKILETAEVGLITIPDVIEFNLDAWFKYEYAFNEILTTVYKYKEYENMVFSGDKTAILKHENILNLVLVSEVHCIENILNSY